MLSSISNSGNGCSFFASKGQRSAVRSRNSGLWLSTYIDGDCPDLRPANSVVSVSAA